MSRYRFFEEFSACFEMFIDSPDFFLYKDCKNIRIRICVARILFDINLVCNSIANLNSIYQSMHLTSGHKEYRSNE